MKKIFSEIKKSLIKNPIWTIYSLLLCPIYYALVFLSALTIGLINLSKEDAVNHWQDNT